GRHLAARGARPGRAGVQPGALLAAGARHRARGGTGLRRARAGAARLLPARRRGADRQVPLRGAGRFPGRRAGPQPGQLLRPAPGRHRRGGGHRGRRAGHLADHGGAVLAAQPARGGVLDRRGAHPRSAHRGAAVAGGRAAAGDPTGPGRRVIALSRLPRGRPLSEPEPAAERVFAAFCAAGLWPGLGSTLAGELAEAGIRGPDDVTASALATLPRVGPVRAGRLVSAFIAAGPAYEVTELLVAAELPTRWAARVIELFGAAAHRLLKDDPWRLLQVTGVDVPDADALARAAIANVQRDDPRRSRALVGFTLARVARDGHTVWP